MSNKNLNRKHLAKIIFKNLGFSKNLSLKIVDNFFNILSAELLESKKVKISSFGTFGVFNKSERIGRNPKTKKEYLIAASKSVKFSVSKKISKFYE